MLFTSYALGEKPRALFKKQLQSDVITPTPKYRTSRRGNIKGVPQVSISNPAYGDSSFYFGEHGLNHGTDLIGALLNIISHVIL